MQRRLLRTAFATLLVALATPALAQEDPQKGHDPARRDRDRSAADAALLERQREHDRQALAERDRARSDGADTGSTLDREAERDRDRAAFDDGDRERERGQVAGARSGPSQLAAQALLWRLHHLNQLEIQLGQLAQERARSASVKGFGKQLARDHQEADKDLVAVASGLGLRFDDPATDTDPGRRPMTADEMHRELSVLDSLRSLRGAEFDRELMEVAIDGHDKAIELIGGHLASVDDPDLKALLQDLLPHLAKHKQLARRVQQNLGLRQAKTPRPRM